LVVDSQQIKRMTADMKKRKTAQLPKKHRGRFTNNQQLFAKKTRKLQLIL